jgi:hypothetical protein
VEVGDFPFLESIFTIFGKLTGVFLDNEPLRTNVQEKGPKIAMMPSKIA